MVARNVCVSMVQGIVSLGRDWSGWVDGRCCGHHTFFSDIDECISVIDNIGFNNKGKKK